MGFGVIAALLALAQNARAEEFVADDLESIVQTRFTELDFDGDGIPDLVRRFDSEGRTVFSESTFPDGTRERYEELEGGRIRETRWRFPDGSWKTVRETWQFSDTWSERETVVGTDGTSTGSLRTLVRFRRPDLLVSKYRWSGGAWKETSRELAPSTLERGGSRAEPPPPPPRPPGPPPLPVPSNASSILACPWTQPPGSNAPVCESFRHELLGVNRVDQLAALTPVECRVGRDLWLSNGFRVDLSTCGASAEDLAWARRTSQDMMKVIRCAAGYNPALARQLFTVISRSAPRIRCLGTQSGENLVRACSEAPNPEDCVRTVKTGEAAGFQQDPSSDLHLTGTGRVQENQRGGLASNLVHELIHAAQIPHDHSLHNSSAHEKYFGSLPAALRTEANRKAITAWQRSDPVYGINLLCGGEPAGAASLPIGHAVGEVDSALDETRPVPRPTPPPNGSMWTPPGNRFEVACSAFMRYRPGADAWDPVDPYVLTEQSSVEPACRTLATERRQTRDRIVAEKRAEEERRARDTRETLDAVFGNP